MARAHSVIQLVLIESDHDACVDTEVRQLQLLVATAHYIAAIVKQVNMVYAGAPHPV